MEKVVGYMTLGINVGELFTDMINVGGNALVSFLTFFSQGDCHKRFGPKENGVLVRCQLCSDTIRHRPACNKHASKGLQR